MITRKLKVLNRYLAYEDGEPFYYLGDTAWSLFHCLSLEDATYFLDTRKEQGFNVIQAVCLSEFNGLTTPNAYGHYVLGKNEKGEYDPTLMIPEYWAHIDRVIELANERDLFVALLPTWGDKYNLRHGDGPIIFTPENAYLYGKLVGERYKDQPNIIWMLGGDRPLQTAEHKAIIDEMARGIREVDNNHLMTFHPAGTRSSADDVRYRDYIDFHTIQSGHEVDCYESYKMLQHTRFVEDFPEKPFMDAEHRYEDHPACFRAHFGYLWDAADIRQNVYWNIFEGACGDTYGNHCIWSMTKEPTDYFPYHWKEALVHEGAYQMQHAMNLRLSRDYYSFKAAPELVEDQHDVMSHIAAGRGKNYAYVYSPLGLPVRVHLAHLEGTVVRCSWFDPRTGTEKPFAIVPARTTTFVPPTSGKGQDWVLVLDVMYRDPEEEQ